MARRSFHAQWLWNRPGDQAFAGAGGEWALPMFSRSTRLEDRDEVVADEDTDSAGSGDHHDHDQACDGEHDGPSDETDDDQAVAPAEVLPQGSVVTTARFAASHSEESDGAISDDHGDVPLDQSPDGDLGAVLNGWEDAFAKGWAAVEASLSGEQSDGADGADGQLLSGDSLTGCLQNVIDGGWALVNDLEESLSNWLGGQHPSAYLGDYLRDNAPDSEFLNRAIPDVVQHLFAMAPQSLDGESCVIGSADFEAQVPSLGAKNLPWIAGSPSGSPADQPLGS